MAKDRLEILAEKMQRIEDEKKKIKMQIQKITAQEKKKERKERAHDLIELGAIFETAFRITSKEDAVKIANHFANAVRDSRKVWRKTELTREEKEKHKIVDFKELSETFPDKEKD